MEKREIISFQLQEGKRINDFCQGIEIKVLIIEDNNSENKLKVKLLRLLLYTVRVRMDLSVVLLRSILKAIFSGSVVISA